MDSELVDTEKLHTCHACGKCTSGCEVNRLDPSFQPHRILRLISMGALGELSAGDALWKCTTCFTCSERCPQGIRVTDILWALREKTAKSGRITELIEAQKDNLHKTGRLYPMDNKKRVKAGLPAVTEDALVISRIFAAVKAEKS